VWAEKEENSNVIMVSYVNELGTEVVFPSGSLAFSNFGTQFGAVYCTACSLHSSLGATCHHRKIRKTNTSNTKNPRPCCSPNSNTQLV